MRDSVEEYVSWSDHKLFKGVGEISYSWWKVHVTRFRKGKETQRHPISITIEYAADLFEKQNRKCALSGLKIRCANTSKRNTASIDRIDSSKGYVVGNIQWVHKDINWMKNVHSSERFIELCKEVAKHNEN